MRADSTSTTESNDCLSFIDDVDTDFGDLSQRATTIGPLDQRPSGLCHFRSEGLNEHTIESHTDPRIDDRLLLLLCSDACGVRRPLDS